MVWINNILRKRAVATGVSVNTPLRVGYGVAPVTPPPGGAPTSDFSVVTNSQLIAALMGDF